MYARLHCHGEKAFSPWIETAFFSANLSWNNSKSWHNIRDWLWYSKHARSLSPWHIHVSLLRRYFVKKHPILRVLLVYDVLWLIHIYFTVMNCNKNSSGLRLNNAKHYLGVVIRLLANTFVTPKWWFKIETTERYDLRMAISFLLTPNPRSVHTISFIVSGIDTSIGRPKRVTWLVLERPHKIR